MREQKFIHKLYRQQKQVLVNVVISLLKNKKAKNSDLETVKKEIDGTNVDVFLTGRDKVPDETALFTAASYGQREIVEYLLSIGAKVELTNEAGQSPFSMAADRESSFPIAVFLLEKGAEAQTARDFMAREEQYAADNGMYYDWNGETRERIERAVEQARQNIATNEQSIGGLVTASGLFSSSATEESKSSTVTHAAPEEERSGDEEGQQIVNNSM